MASEEAVPTAVLVDLHRQIDTLAMLNPPALLALQMIVRLMVGQALKAVAQQRDTTRDA